ncbi:MAG: glycosyltransferase [Clostridia bacterium]|nr:glycosyltransferase [Clostridia bacterium]
MSVKLSIIVPVYNVEKYISECLESLVNQTINNYEIIVVIDGSQDKSIDIVKEYKERYPNIINFFETKNKGLSAARNYGLERAKGEYVGFVDSDDYVGISMFEKLYNYAEINKCDIVVCNYNRIMEKEKREVKLEIKNEDSKEKIILKSKPYSWNKIYKREIFNKYNIQFPEGLIFEDICTIYPLLIQANKIGYINENLYFYRFNRKDSIMKNKNRKDMHMFLVLEKLNNYCAKHGLFEKYKDLICELNVRHIFFRIRERTKYFSVRIRKIKFIQKGFEFLNINFPNWKQTSEYMNNIQKIKHFYLFWVLKVLVKG